MSRRRMTGARDQRGSGTLLVLAVMVFLLSAGMVCAVWAAISLGHHRAVAAAELAALSAAQAGQAGADTCGTAALIAQEHGAEVMRCAVDGDEVEIAVAVQLRLGVLGSSQVRAAARAGPALGPAIGS